MSIRLKWIKLAISIMDLYLSEYLNFFIRNKIVNIYYSNLCIKFITSSEYMWKSLGTQFAMFPNKRGHSRCRCRHRDGLISLCLCWDFILYIFHFQWRSTCSPSSVSLYAAASSPHFYPAHVDGIEYNYICTSKSFSVMDHLLYVCVIFVAGSRKSTSDTS